MDRLLGPSLPPPPALADGVFALARPSRRAFARDRLLAGHSLRFLEECHCGEKPLCSKVLRHAQPWYQHIKFDPRAV